MEDKRINEEMQELLNILGEDSIGIEWLKKAMDSSLSKDLNKKSSNHNNEGLSTVGDAVLKAVLADYFYNNRITTDYGITEKKKYYESNDTLHEVVIKYRINKYGYNDKHFNKDENIPDHEKVVDKKHDVYLEAIIGAMYFNRGYDKTKEWINNWLLPKLKEVSKKNK